MAVRRFGSWERVFFVNFMSGDLGCIYGYCFTLFSLVLGTS
jgi:hypothetical protein